MEALQQQGLIPLDLRESVAAAEGVTVASLVSLLRSKSGIGLRELLTLSQSLASLLGAGLTVDRALQIAGRLASKSWSRELTLRLLQSVRSGKPLSGAFSECGVPLPPYFLSMIEAGEASGALPQTMLRLTELLAQQMEVRERIRSALVYPTILAIVLTVTLVVLLAFVLPRFEGLFAESEAAIPWSTRAVLDVGRFVADFWLMIIMALGVTLLGCMAWLRTPEGRSRWHRWLLKSRFTLSLPQSINTARLLRTLSTLCASGIPLPQALKVARGTLVNIHLNDAMGRVIQDVQAGETLSTALERRREFPEVAIQLARVGEETGRLDPLLASAAMSLEEESRRQLDRLLTVAVPLVTVLMGAIVAGLIGSVLIGLLSINDLAF
jgi:general secretion pathway protein F